MNSQSDGIRTRDSLGSPEPLTKCPRRIRDTDCVLLDTVATVDVLKANIIHLFCGVCGNRTRDLLRDKQEL